MNRTPDVKAKIELLATEDDGRITPAISGYRPNHLIKDDYLTSGKHRYLDVEELAPGKSSVAEITLLDPERYPHSLWIGKRINIQEGSRLVGYATIIEIYNQLLSGQP